VAISYLKVYKVVFSMKYMKRLILISFVLMVVLVGVSGVNALVCGLPDAQGQDQLIMRLSGSTNAHGEVWDGLGNYPIEICYNDPDIFNTDYVPGVGVNPHACTGNNAVVGLSGSTNAHGEQHELNNYPIEVCFGDLACAYAAGACPPGKVEVLQHGSSVGGTNFHLAERSSGYPIKVCCGSSFTGGGTTDGDGDGILDDGDGSGTPGDNPCTGGETANCDDNCPITPNPLQEDDESDGVGNVCDNCRVVVNSGQEDNNGVSDGDCPAFPFTSDPLCGDACEIPSCTDECPSDEELECSGDGIRSCGDFDADSCLEWSSVTSCGAGESCISGPPVKCTGTGPGCVLTAGWEGPGGITELVEGTDLSMKALGQNCNGAEVRFDIWEKDLGITADFVGWIDGDDSISDDHARVNLAGPTTTQVAVTTWTTAFHNDCGGTCLPNEFYFVAYLVSDPGISSTSGLFSVTEMPACTDTCSSLGLECGVHDVCGVSTDCGAVTGGCGVGESCSVGGQCEPIICTPDCTGGKVCGGDGCGGSCGSCPAGEGCDSGGQCVDTACVVDADCSDGNECTTNTCDVVGAPGADARGCVVGDVTDGTECSTGLCYSGACECQSNSDCDDGLFCNGIETCNLGTGACSNPPDACGDGNACTTDTCDEAADSCSNPPVAGQCIDVHWADESEGILPVGYEAYIGDVIKLLAYTAGYAAGETVTFEITEDDPFDDDNIRTGDEALSANVRDDGTGDAVGTWIIDEADLDAANRNDVILGIGEDEFESDGHGEFLLEGSIGSESDSNSELFVKNENRPLNEGCSFYTEREACNTDTVQWRDPVHDPDGNNCGKRISGGDRDSCLVECYCEWNNAQSTCNFRTADVECPDPDDPSGGGGGKKGIVCEQGVISVSECEGGFKTTEFENNKIGITPVGQSCPTIGPSVTPCGRAIIELPFFGIQQIVLSLVAIASLYIIFFGLGKIRRVKD
jgi:hypothetical protein